MLLDFDKTKMNGHSVIFSGWIYDFDSQWWQPGCTTKKWGL